MEKEEKLEKTEKLTFGMRFQAWIQRVPGFLEKIVAAVLVISVVYCCGNLFLKAVSFGGTDADAYLQSTIGTAFNIVIAIEFLRMLVKHSMRTILEVLIFALARGLIVDKGTALHMLTCIGCIAVLLVCRKFLFHPHDLQDLLKPTDKH